MTQADRESPLDHALDELYAATPPEFVLVRARLERALRDQDQAAAADLRARRRPHLAAWATNQLARRDPTGIANLVSLTGQLGAQQQAVVDGRSPDAWRRVTRERRDLLEQLSAAGTAALREWAPKPASYRDTIAATLDAASLDPDLAPDLVAGRLTRALAAPAGLGPFPDPNAPGPSAPSAGGRPDRRALDAARRELTTARAEMTDLTGAADTAATEQASAEMQADATAVQLREVERAIERARVAARHAAQAAQHARDRARDARRAADQAEQRVRRAEQDLRDLEAT